MKKQTKSSWRDVKEHYEDFLKIFPHLRADGKTKSTFNIMALWEYATTLRNEKRYEELIWIQPNLIDIEINTMLSSYFFIKNNIHYERAKKFVMTLNFYEKNNLLLLLGIVNESIFNKLEKYRKLRNNLIHKLMGKIKSGEELDTLSKTMCNIGFELQQKLRDAHPAWKFIREGKPF